MKDSKKNRPPARKAERYRIGTPARERVTVSTKLEEGTYRKLTDAAVANRNSISTEVELRIEKSFEPNLTQPSNDMLVALGAHVIHAFRMGGRMENPDRPLQEWLKDPLAYDRALLRAYEALLDWHPKLTRPAFDGLIDAFQSRVHQAFLTAEKGEVSKRSPTLPHLPTKDEGED